jgi:hypothetical protein
MGRLVQFPGAATAKALADVIGKPGLLTVEGMRVGVQIIDARIASGRHDVLVEPTNGVGRAWVSRERVTIGPGSWDGEPPLPEGRPRRAARASARVKLIDKKEGN